MLILIQNIASTSVPFQICDGINNLARGNSSEIAYPNKNGWYGKIHYENGQFDPSPYISQARTYSKSVSCQPEVANTYCVQSKGKANCAEFYTEEMLRATKNKLLVGGYNCFSRHEKTYWQQYTGEVGCKKNANCVDLYNDPDKPWATTSRYLSPWGHQASKYAAGALKNLGLDVTVGNAKSSPFPRCLANLKHSFPNATSDERLMYTGSALENIKRKRLCDNNVNSTAAQVEESLASGAISDNLVNELIFDYMRQMAGTPPADGKNNFYNSHGFNMKGAFGQQIDEGYMMCLKPTEAPYPIPNREHRVCGCTLCDQPTVDFNGVKQFGLDFILSSEAFLLMEALDDPQFQRPGIIYDDGKLNATEIGVGPFNKLMELQAHAIAETKVSILEPNAYHVKTFAHINGGYRDNTLQTVHTPLRNVLENSIASNATFAIVQAIIAGGDFVWDGCTADPAVESALAKCYSAKSEPAWYWGGKDKATINGQQSYTNPKFYGTYKWPPTSQDNPTWFPDPYVSGYVHAAACLVKSNNVDLSTLMTNMGCADKAKQCHEVKQAYQTSKCCDGAPAQLSVL
jgi:hypothetical protein